MTSWFICKYINNILRYVIGDKKYLLENQEDYEEIKKLNETLVGYLDVRYITIYE